MDKATLKGYFTKGSKQNSTRNTSDLSPNKNEQSSGRSNKEINKKRSGRLDTFSNKEVNNVIMEMDSDGESPLPSSVRKSMATKRARAYISSDSDAEECIVTQTAKEKVADKHRSKKAKIDSDSDEESGKSKKQVVTIEESSDEETVTDSEDEFVEKKVPKKKGKLLPGQTTLNFSKSTAKTSTSAAKTTKSDKPMSATDFFGGGVKKVEKSAPKIEKVENRSPPSKENIPLSKKEEKKKVSLEKDSSSISEKQQLTKSKKDLTPKKADVKIASSPAKKTKTPEKKETATKPPKSIEKNSTLTKAAISEKKLSPIKKKEIVPAKSESKEKKVSPVKSNLKSTQGSEPKEYEVPWVDKHRPKSLAQLVGQHGDKSPLNKMLGWLKDWAKHNLGEGAKIKKPKPAPFATQVDGSPFKAALLSGSPGIGKTSSAHLACESMGFKVVEMNASDVRNKKHLEAQIAQLTGSHQIEEYFGKKNMEVKSDDLKVHHVLIMDEVDGMSGNEDRAGMAELIQMIKDTKIPILCICNDRAHPKIRSLANHCYDIRFPKPRVEQIRSRIMSIACQEKVKISKEELDQMIELSGHDVRQIIYNLQMRGASTDGQVQKKDCAINTFEAARKLLDSRATLAEKQEMFFVDYGIMPLFVQENYPNMKSDKHTNLDAIRGLRRAADLISMGDITDKCLRTTGAWKLLNEECMFACALPSIAVGGHLRAMIQFPAWLGKNSTSGKRHRLMRQLASHAHLKISADTQSLVTDYVPVLRDRLTRPLLAEENNGIQTVIDTMTEYDLLKDDAEAIGELAVWPGKIDPAVKIQSKVKAALTRALNKTTRMLPYAIDDMTKGKKKKGSSITDLEIDEEGNLVERAIGEEGEEEGSDGEEEEKAVAKVVTGSAAGKARGGGRGAARGGRGGRGRGK